MNFHYRIGAVSDLEQLQRLGIGAYSEFKHVLAPESWNQLHAGLQNTALLKKIVENSTAFVCETAGEIAGVAYLVPSGNPEGVFQHDWSYIRRVGVDPRYRGKGIARKLTGLCISHARETNEKIIALHTSEFMDAARHVYESLGFVRLKEIDRIFGKRYWLYTMQLK